MKVEIRRGKRGRFRPVIRFDDGTFALIGHPRGFDTYDKAFFAVKRAMSEEVHIKDGDGFEHYGGYRDIMD